MHVSCMLNTCMLQACDMHGKHPKNMHATCMYQATVTCIQHVHCYLHFTSCSVHVTCMLYNILSRMKHTFQIALSYDSMLRETRDTLHHGQLQEGLLHDFMQAPAVSEAHTYKELCLASQNDEKKMAELQKRRQYQQPAKATFKSPADKCGEPRES